MKVLLLQSIPKLGMPGDVKDVAVGYARNYLLPQELAVHADDSRARVLRGQVAAKRKQAEADRKVAEETAKEWAGKIVKLEGKATADGTLYAAITARDIASELGLDPKRVHFDSIKNAGSYEARIDVGEGVDAAVGVIVTVTK